MLVEAALLTGVGMTTVFAFLGLLVCLMHASAKVIERFPGAPNRDSSLMAPSVESARNEAEVAAVLAVIASQRGEA